MTDTTPWPGRPATSEVPAGPPSSAAHEAFRRARDLLLELRTDAPGARQRFRWPDLYQFNWARDWFDHLAADPVTGSRTALWVLGRQEADDVFLSYAELADRSRRLATWLASLGAMRGDRVLVMLDNQVELWESILACMRLGVAVIPASTHLGAADLRDRIDRGAARFVIARSADTPKFAGHQGGWTPIAVGPPPPGWQDYGESADASPLTGTADTEGGDTLLLYFTSGTTARPKLVEHTHVSYPVGHLSTMYWIGLRPGDIHLNLAPPGWAKHAWSTVFAPWNAEATAVAMPSSGLDAVSVLEAMERARVTTFCALPTAWRMLAEADLPAWRDRIAVRELVGAGERLNPTVVTHLEQAWGRTVREGFGQTETTALVGNPPGQPIVPGSMGRALPGYDVTVLDPVTRRPVPVGGEGELCLRLAPTDDDGTPLGRPIGLMAGYRNDESRTAETMHDGYYHTGDVVRRLDEDYLVHVGRGDEVFKAAGHRISPFELESVLVGHPAVAEAAVVPSPGPGGAQVPKAFVTLAAGWEPGVATAAAILRQANEHLSEHNHIARLQFAELPKTAAGKIRRVALREQEAARAGGEADRQPGEYRAHEVLR